MADPNHQADARAAAVGALADALAAELGLIRHLPAGLVPRSWIERIARRQLAAIMALEAPTRAALLGPIEQRKRP